MTRKWEWVRISKLNWLWTRKSLRVYMSSRLLSVANEHNSIVAVVRKGHLQRIKKHWQQPVAASHVVRHGDKVECSISELQPLKAEGEDIPLDIVYEDDHVLVVNKPAHMGKLQQNRKYYATYNALLEIKEPLLKETSLLNSEFTGGRGVWTVYSCIYIVYVQDAGVKAILFEESIVKQKDPTQGI
ncbi:Pseudouridine synthase, catalytic domain-containing protein [Artemisia annua]|uniref:Pseudouridine synthase, catalytic domain-containing protein n=1 Tax=Artemisia annua TaxID=35608 RepID=A0A2U1PH36_ARTAN|nr:Pseudouridine synthase, catalytic domain-containing protein [Artemisia annua]